MSGKNPGSAAASRQGGRRRREKKKKGRSARSVCFAFKGHRQVWSSWCVDLTETGAAGPSALAAPEQWSIAWTHCILSVHVPQFLRLPAWVGCHCQPQARLCALAAPHETLYKDSPCTFVSLSINPFYQERQEGWTLSINKILISFLTAILSKFCNEKCIRKILFNPNNVEVPMWSIFIPLGSHYLNMYPLT